VVNVRDELSAVFGPVPGTRSRHLAVCGWRVRCDSAGVAPCHPVCAGRTGCRRPVKLVVTRRQMYTGTGYRPETWQRVALAASRDGRLKAIIHHGTAETSTYEQYVERLLESTGFLHSCQHVETRYRLLPLNVHTRSTCARRARPAAFLRSNVPWMNSRMHSAWILWRCVCATSRRGMSIPTGLFPAGRTRECYRLAAERFGWVARTPEPSFHARRPVADRLGMATAVYHTFRWPAARAFGCSPTAARSSRVLRVIWGREPTPP